MLRTFAIAFLVVAAGCGGQTNNSDSAADDAALAGLASGKSDAVAAEQATVVGDWALASAAGDIWYLWLRADGNFAWTRCYDADCNDPVVESGTYVLTTSSGKKYVAFYQSGPVGDAKQHFNAMYQYTRGKSGLELRRVRQSAWMMFDAVSDEELCNSSGGAWNGGCSCGAWPMAWSPGAGGCWQSPSAGESACDDTSGVYSDDETNAAGTFCDCGYGRVLTDSGCQAR